jgi:prophage regulatory protein
MGSTLRQVMTPMTRLLRLREVLQTTGLTRSTMYSLAARGLFPRPYKISARASAWRESELRQWAEGLQQNTVAPTGHATCRPRRKALP